MERTTIRVNPAKCAALSVTTDRNGNPTADKDLHLRLDDEILPTLDLHSSYSYLGIGDGFNHVKRRFVMGPKLLQMKKQTSILRAIKTYVHSQATYLLRHTRPVQEQLQSYDKLLASGLRHLLRLPKTATAHAIFTPIANSGLGFVPLADQHAALQISHVLAVIDKRHQLHREHWKDREEEFIQLFLNSELQSSPFAPIKRHHGDIGSLWVDVQRQLRVRQLKFSKQEIDGEQRWLQLVAPHDDRPLTTKNITAQLSRAVQIKYTDAWKQLKDQGRTVRAHGRIGSDFIKNGKGMWDQDYEFAIRARLNQVATRSTLKRQRQRHNGACKRATCSHPETLLHILNNCAANMEAVRAIATPLYSHAALSVLTFVSSVQMSILKDWCISKSN